MSNSFTIAYEKINEFYMKYNDIEKTQIEISNLEIGARTKNWMSRFFELRDAGVITISDPSKTLSKSDIRDIITTDYEIIKKFEKSQDSKTTDTKNKKEKKDFLFNFTK